MMAESRLEALRGLDYNQPANRWKLWQFMRAWIDTGMTTGQEGRTWRIRRSDGRVMAESSNLGTLFSTAHRRALEAWRALSPEDRKAHEGEARMIEAERLWRDKCGANGWVR